MRLGRPEQNRAPTLLPGDLATVLYVRRMLDVLALFGIAEDALLDELGVAPELLADPDARVPKHVVARAWERTAELTGLVNLGLKVADLAAPGTLDVLDHLTANQPDLERAGRVTVKFYRLCDPHLDMRFEVGPRGCGIRCHFPMADGAYSRHWPEALFGLMIGRCRALAERPDLKPVQVTFQHHAPRDRREHDAFFRCPIVFDAGFTEIVYPLDICRLPVKRADPFLSRVLIEYAERELAKLPEEQAMSALVRRSLHRRLQGGDLSLAAVAKEARCSPRTVQSRLHAEGSSFSSVLDQVRKEQALRYVADPAFRLAEIPLLLQYTEASPFYRAFRKWTGMTPVAYRRLATGAPRPALQPLAASS